MARHRGGGDGPRIYTPTQKAMRYAQVAAYAAVSAAVFAYGVREQRSGGSLVALIWLMGIYMGARALAIYIRFRQEMRGPRYSRAYTEARDLFTQAPDADISHPQESTHPTQHDEDGSSHG